MASTKSNNYFQFKEFKIIQDRSPMKVCTDACILGALANHENPKRILDIGSGTGLLSLMLAQKYQCPIDAVEMHLPSMEESLKNIQNSKWKDLITVHHTKIQDYSTTHQYDLIISNPPFYKSQQKSQDPERNMAHHNDFLPITDLVKSVLSLLSPQGVFFVLYPPHETAVIKKMMMLAGLNLNQIWKIKNSPEAEVIREISSFSRHINSFFCTEVVIKRNILDYTDEFVQLLKPYYLYL